MELAIKNMVCNRCIMTVKNTLVKLNIPHIKVALGMISLENKLTRVEMKQLAYELKMFGFEILSQKESVIVEKVKTELIQIVEKQSLNRLQQNMSVYLANEIGINYAKLSKLFSSIVGKTIEQYLIEIKIEKVKELIRYNELSISEISYELGYSTPQHLSRQFRQVTGMTSTEFKKQGERKELDKI